MKRAFMMALVVGSFLATNSGAANAQSHFHGGNVRSSGFGLSLNFGSPAGYNSGLNYNRGFSNGYGNVYGSGHGSGYGNIYGGHQRTHGNYLSQGYSRHGSYYPTTAYRQAVPSYGFSNFNQRRSCGY
jgi:hypothetical protein